MRVLTNKEQPIRACYGLLRAPTISKGVSANTKLTVHDIAREEGVMQPPLQPSTAPLAAPDITTAIINGRQPAPTQRQGVDAQGLATPRRLERATHAARILKSSGRVATVRSLTSALMALRPRRGGARHQARQPQNDPGEIFVVTRVERTRTFIFFGMPRAKKYPPIGGEMPQDKVARLPFAKMRSISDSARLVSPRNLDRPQALYTRVLQRGVNR